MQKRQILRTLGGIGRGILMAALALAALLALVSFMVVIQGQRDEARPVGAVVVLGEPAGSGDLAAARVARFEHADELYRQGLVSRIILSGSSTAQLGQQYLTNQGLPPRALLLEDQSVTMVESIRASAAVARSQGVSSVMIVADPPHMLAALKIARDEGLTAYGSPTHSAPGAENPAAEVFVVLRESWNYLAYLFTGQ